MTELKVATMITKNSATVNFNGESYTVYKEDPVYAKVVLAIREGRKDDLPSLVSKPKLIEKGSNGVFTVREGQVYVEGNRVEPALGRQILDFMNEGLPFQPLVNFWKRLQKNPSERAVNSLYKFLEQNRHPITEEGKFIAYKKVRRHEDGVLRDIHTGTYVNDPGTVCEMPRDQVDDDPTRTCSNGLHVSNWDYASNVFGTSSDVMLECEVDPEFVVAIPNDYNESKMRVCAYKVRTVVANPNPNKHLVQDEELPETEPLK